LIRNLTTEEYQNEKLRIIELMFSPYSSKNSDEHISGQQVAKDKIQNRIDFQMIQNRINKESAIQEDVYMFTFEQLLKLNERNSKKFVDGYYKNPDSVYHFAYYLLKIKGFAVNPKRPLYPKQSLAKSIVYGSAFNQQNISVCISEDVNTEGEQRYSDEVIIYDNTGEPEPFEKKYNITIEDIISKLTPDEQELFYQMAGKAKGLKKKDKAIEVMKLQIKIKEIKDKINNMMTEQEQYTLLLTLEEKLAFFNQYGEVTLTGEDLETLKTLYTVYFSQFKALNTTCSSCIKEMLNVGISRLGALKKQFDMVAPPVEETPVEAVKTVKPTPVKKNTRKK
jgi:hypothetical protein